MGSLGALGVAIVIVGFELVDVVRLNLAIQVLNGVAMPFTVGMLFLLSLDPKVFRAGRSLGRSIV